MSDDVSGHATELDSEIARLHDAQNEASKNVWRFVKKTGFDEAADGTLVAKVKRVRVPRTSVDPKTGDIIRGTIELEVPSLTLAPVPSLHITSASITAGVDTPLDVHVEFGPAPLPVGLLQLMEVLANSMTPGEFAPDADPT